MAALFLFPNFIALYTAGVCLAHLVLMPRVAASPTLESLKNRLNILDMQYTTLLHMLANEKESSSNLRAELGRIRRQLNETVAETRSSIAQTEQRSLAMDVFNTASSRVDEIRQNLVIEKEERFRLESEFSEVKGSVLGMVKNTDEKWAKAISASEDENAERQRGFDKRMIQFKAEWATAMKAIEDKNAQIQADFDKQMINFQAEWDTLKKRAADTDSKVRADFQKTTKALTAHQNPWLTRLSKLEESVACQENCPVGSEKFLCQCYMLHKKALTFDKSQQICKETGGDLVMPKTKEERDFVKGLIRSSATMVWLGIHRDETFSDWIYTDNTTMDDSIYWNKIFGKLNYSSSYRCVSANKYGHLQWTGGKCASLRFGYVCQKSLSG